MKTLNNVFICLLMLCLSNRIQMYRDDIFSVECVSSSMALLKTDDSKYRVTLPFNCTYNTIEGNHTLGPGCLSEKKVIVVSPKLIGGFHLAGGKETRVFTVSCLDTLDANGTQVNTSVDVQITSNPRHLHIPVSTVKMFLTSVDPNSSVSLPPALSDSQIVGLGEKLYLVIASPRQGKGSQQFFLPEECGASSAPPLNLTIGIWNKTSVDRQCIEQPSLMDKFTVYPNGKKYGDQSYNFAHAPIFTFYFEQLYVHENTITYKCTLLVCPQSSQNKGVCGQELQRLSSSSTKCVNLIKATAKSRRDVRTSSHVKLETETLSVSVRVRRPSIGESQEGSTSGTIVIMTTGILIPIIIIIAILVIILLLCDRRKRRKRVKQQLQQIQLEMTDRLL